MKDIYNILLYLVLVAEFVAAYLSSSNFIKIKFSPLRYIMPLLWFILLTELFAALQARIFDWPNMWIYNISEIVWFTVIANIYYRYIFEASLKRLIKVFALIYFASYFINIFWVNGGDFMKLNNYSYTVGSLLLSIVIFSYLRNILNSKEVLYLRSKLMVWISLGLLTYHVTLIPIQSLYSFLREITEGNVYNLGSIQMIITIMMYIIFGVGFVVSRKERINNLSGVG